jgi:hypothetical protein
MDNVPDELRLVVTARGSSPDTNRHPSEASPNGASSSVPMTGLLPGRYLQIPPSRSSFRGVRVLSLADLL